MKKLFLLALILVFATSCTKNTVKLPVIYGSANQKNLLEDQYKQKTEKAPKDDKSYYVLSYILLKNNKPEQALMTIDKAIFLSTFRYEYHILRGQILYALQDYTSALNSFTKAYYYDRSSYISYLEIAKTYYTTFDYANARMWIERALAINNQDFEILLTEVKISLKSEKNQNNYLLNLKKLLELQAKKPKSTEVLLILAQLHFDYSYLKRAKAVIEDFLSKYNTISKIDSFLCETNSKLGEIKSANSILEKLTPNSSDHLICKVNILMNQEKFDESYQLLKKYSSIHRQYKIKLLEIDLLFAMQRGKLASEKLAELTFKEDLEASIRSKYLLAYSFLLREDYMQAKERIKEYLERHPYDTDAILLAAKIFTKTNDFENAKKLLDGVSFNETSRDSYITEAYADILLDKKDYTQAKKLYENSQLMFFRPSVEAKLITIDYISQNNKNQKKLNARIEELLNNYPKNYESKIKMAKLLYIQGRYKETTKILQTIPRPFEILNAGMFLGLSLIEEGQTKDGIDMLIETTKFFDSSVQLFDALSYQLARNGQYLEAINYLSRIIYVAPVNSRHLNQRLADLYKVTSNESGEKESLLRYYY